MLVQFFPYTKALKKFHRPEKILEKSCKNPGKILEKILEKFWKNPAKILEVCPDQRRRAMVQNVPSQITSISFMRSFLEGENCSFNVLVIPVLVSGIAGIV